MNSPLCYVGGKSKLSKIICDLIPAHKTYCEVFAGAAWVFFRKEYSKYEVINDKDGDLITFYRVVQNHLEEFLRQFRWLLSSREIWNDFKRQAEAGGLTDIQRAARYYYLQRMCFGGRVRGRTFGVSPERPPRINLLRLEEEMSDIHLRLVNVLIENLDYSELLKKYDKPETFFYLDPPYYKSPVYVHNFTALSDFKALSDALKLVNGKFILSLNDHADIREVFSDFNIKPVAVAYSVNSKKSTIGKELLISNFSKVY
jgi:DNA adenine methylase